MISKSRLARRNFSIPRLALVAAHMTGNLAENVKICLNKLIVRKIYAWSESSSVLDWLKGNGEYKIFVSNRVSKIKRSSFIACKYVPTKENSADLGVEVVKYESLVINGGKVPYGPKIKHYDHNQ